MDLAETQARAQAIAGCQFNNLPLLAVSLTHASVANSRGESNERLEFLGDAILGLVVCQELYRQFPDLQEGDLTKMKSLLVSGRVCAEIADSIDLTPLLVLGKGVGERGEVPMSLKAAVLEAFVAAIHLDAGFEQAESFVLRHIRPYIAETADSAHQENYKSQLQQYAQKRLSGTPRYESLDEQGPDHSKCFEVCVVINGRTFLGAWGPSKKEAEQKAAKRALEELGILKASPSSD